MLGNPFIALWRNPVQTLTAAAYAAVLLSGLVASWWAAGMNALYLRERWQDGWLVLIPLTYTLRTIAMLLIAALDLLLVAGIIHILR